MRMPLPSPRRTNFEGRFIDSNSPVGRLLAGSAAYDGRDGLRRPARDDDRDANLKAAYRWLKERFEGADDHEHGPDDEPDKKWLQQHFWNQSGATDDDDRLAEVKAFIKANMDPAKYSELCRMLGIEGDEPDANDRIPRRTVRDGARRAMDAKVRTSSASRASFLSRFPSCGRFA